MLLLMVFLTGAGKQREDDGTMKHSDYCWDEEQKALERFSHLIMTECLRDNEVLRSMETRNP